MKISTGSTLLRIFAIFSLLTITVGIVSASEVGQNASPTFCERFPALSRFPVCQPPPPPPPPTDACPNVPGNQTSRPCADDRCKEQGGIWHGDSCEFPTPPPPSDNNSGRGHDLCQRYIESASRIAPPESCDICPNVSGVQLQGDCVDKICADDGGTWSENSCVMPPLDICPNVPGDQAEGPCADEQCSEQGGTWNDTSCVMPPVSSAQCSDGLDNDADGKIDFPADGGCSSASDDSETGSGGGAAGGSGGRVIAN
ncbi:MAG: hypothetical protein RLZZ416_395 [Candidatus Parcubacteria bacterium]|jgi:hypothetical protein